MRGWSRLRENFARLGRKIKLGVATDRDRAQYKELGTIMRSLKTMRRHGKWQVLYDKVYAAKEIENLAVNMTEKRAKFQAHLAAQAAVANQFQVTERTARKSIITYD